MEHFRRLSKFYLTAKFQKNWSNGLKNISERTYVRTWFLRSPTTSSRDQNIVYGYFQSVNICVFNSYSIVILILTFYSIDWLILWNIYIIIMFSSNHTLNCFVRKLCRLTTIPDILLLYMDNCWRENKNQVCWIFISPE